MKRLLVLRHGPTAWNTRGAIQGRADPPLSPDGRARVRNWRLPAGHETGRWIASPLQRAMETARLLGGDPIPEPRLLELDWGDWQGRKLADLRSDPAENMGEREAKGLDFQPPGGESYRMVQQRLLPWLRERHADPAPESDIVVCHKGVIQALYALATGWEMTGPPAEKLRDDCCHEFHLDGAGRPVPGRLNQSMLP